MRTKQCLTLDDVKKMLAPCEAEAAKNKWAVAIAVVDKAVMGLTHRDREFALPAAVQLAEAGIAVGSG